MLAVILYAIYYCLMLGGMILLSFIFPKAVIFELSSAVPILVAIFMLFQAYSLNKSHVKKDATDEKQLEVNDYVKCVSHSYIASAPLCFPMIFFLPALGKSISILPFLTALVIGSSVYKRRKQKRAAEKSAAEESEANE